MTELPKGLPSEFYGDHVRWFTGLVINARPPAGEGLEGYVQVRIHGVHSPSLEDIPQSALPWAQVLIPTTEGGTSGLGSTPRIEAGTLIFGFFMDGKYSQVPIVIGSLPHITTPTPIQLGFDPIGDDADTIQELLDLVSVENENTGDITSQVKDSRIGGTLKKALDAGLDFESAIALTAELDIASGMITGGHDDGSFGIDNFTGTRLDSLKNSSPDFQNFDKQVDFVLKELTETKPKILGRSLSSKVEAVCSTTGTDVGDVKRKAYELNDKYGGG